MPTRLIYAVLSTVTLAVLGILALRGVVAYEDSALVTTQELLVAGAERIELDLGRSAMSVPGLAVRFSATEGLGQDLRGLANAVNLTPLSGRVPERLRQRIDSVRGKLLEQIAVFRETAPEVAAVTIVDDAGVVLVRTDGSSFEVADSLAADPAEAGALEPSDSETEAASATGSAAGFRLTALGGAQQRATLVTDHGIRFVGAASVPLRARIAGAVIIEVEVQALPRAPGAEAFVLLGQVPALGAAPAGFEPGALVAGDEPFLLVPGQAKAAVPVLGEMEVGPFFLEGDEIGVWARTFQVSGAPEDVRGVIFADVAPLYGKLAGFQISMLVLSFLVIVIHVSILLLGGRRLRDGVEEMTGRLAAMREGRAQLQRLSDGRLPPALAALASQIDAFVGRVGGVAPLPRSPSLDEVVEAQAIGESPDGADLQFEGITGSGSLGVDTANDGFESLGDVVDAAASGLAVQQDEEAHPADLPDAPDAADAIDHLHEASSPGWEFGEEPTVEQPMPGAAANAGLDASRDAAPSAASDGGPEAAADELLGAEPEEAADAEPGHRPEAAPDALPEAAADELLGAEPEEAADAEPGHRPEAGPDAPPEAVSDASPEAEPDALPEAEPDALPEAEPDALPEAEPDASPEAAADELPEAEPDEVIEAEANASGDRMAGGPDVALSKQPAKPPPARDQDLGDLLDEYASDATTVMQLSPELVSAMESATGDDADEASAPAAEAVDEMHGRPTANLSQPDARGEEPSEIAADDLVEEEEEDPEEMHFREVYDEFLRTRETCGEATSDLTFERFSAKLTKSRDAVVSKHDCSSVRFQVYVKNGKAALKAIPIR